MVYLLVILLLAAAAGCFGLSRRISTQLLGYGASAVTVVALLLLLLSPALPALPALRWMALDGLDLAFTPDLAAGRGPVLALLSGGVLALGALATAIAAPVRGFGGIFGWALLLLAAALAGTGFTAGLSALAWAIAALAAYAAVRASGALGRSELLPRGLGLGLLAAVLLAAGSLAAQPALAEGLPPEWPAFVLVLVGCLAFTGAAPFHSSLAEAEQAPAALGALIYGLVFPTLGLSTLARFLSELPVVPPAWRTFLLLVGLAGALGCSAGAIGERSLRRVLAWLVGAQAGAVVIALGLEGAYAAAAAQALLTNLMLTTVAGALATAALEWSCGSDDYTRACPTTPLYVPGLVWALAAASALGLPALWGFWGRLWLFEAAAAGAPWLVPPLIIALVLAAPAGLVPLACFWGSFTSPTGAPPPQRAPLLITWLPLLALILLLVLGLAPQLAWAAWLVTVAPALADPAPAGARSAAIAGAVGLALLLLALRRSQIIRQMPRDRDVEPALFAPLALAASLSWLVALGNPEWLIQRIWQILMIVSGWARAAFGLFERRFYLAGVVLALIVLMILMAQ